MDLTLIKSAVRSLGVKGLGAVAGLVSSVLIARALGSSGAGTYYLALTCLTALSVFGRAGTDVTALKGVAAHVSRGEEAIARAIERWCLRRLLIVTSVAWVLLSLFAVLAAAKVFSDDAIVQPLLVIGLGLLPLAITSLFAEVLKARGRVAMGMAVQSLCIPLFVAIGIVAFGAVVDAMAAHHVAATYVAAALTTAAISSVLVLWARRERWSDSPRDRLDLDEAHLADLRSSSNVYMMIGLQNLVLSMTDTLMLGVLSDATAVGLYAVALRVTGIGALVLAAVNGVVAPRFAGLVAINDFDALARIARASTRIMAVSAVVLIGTLYLLREPILATFGQEFVAAEQAYAILCLGQLVVLGTGPVAYLLMMSGNQRFHRASLTAAAVSNIALNLLLIPSFGIVGAAIATAVSLGAKNLVTFIFVRLRMGFWMLP